VNEIKCSKCGLAMTYKGIHHEFYKNASDVNDKENGKVISTWEMYECKTCYKIKYILIG
jgi:hypothetical protein